VRSGQRPGQSSKGESRLSKVVTNPLMLLERFEKRNGDYLFHVTSSCLLVVEKTQTQRLLRYALVSGDAGGGAAWVIQRVSDNE
jgi:hypothetical protein